MAMSYAAAKAALRAAIAGLTPTVDPTAGFVSIIDATAGARRRLEELPAGQRYFEIATDTFPTPTVGGCRHECRMLVRLRYQRTGDFDPVETLILEDVAQISRALRKGSNWDQDASGLTGVRPGEPFAENFPADGEPEFSIVAIPLTITIRSC